MEIKMSEDLDDLDLDEDDIQSLMEEQDPDMMTPEDVFKMVLLNKRNKTRVSVSLEDKDGDPIELSDMMEELVNFLKDKMDDEEGNQVVEQIMPLMSQALVSGLGRLVGNQATAFLIANPDVRMALIYMMMISFILYKTVQVKGLKVITQIEPVTGEEIEEIERKSRASSIASMTAMVGMDPKEILSQMVARGDLTSDDFKDLMGQASEDELEDDDIS